MQEVTLFNLSVFYLHKLDLCVTLKYVALVEVCQTLSSLGKYQCYDVIFYIAHWKSQNHKMFQDIFKAGTES